MKRLKQSSATIADNGAREGDSDASIVRPAILVHAGPDGTPMEFQSGDGPIAFDDDRIQRLVDNHNAMMTDLANQYGGVDKMPVGAWPPILDQHEDDSSHRISGRLNSLLRFERRDVPGVGANVACACANITFLGKDIVDRVKDGRIYHLSIGINEDTDTLGETSIVIEPAAPGAMLLSRKTGAKRRNKGAKHMSKKRLEAQRARKAALTEIVAIGEQMTKMSLKVKADLVVQKETIRLKKNRAAVTARLKGLVKSGRMTPADFKKQIPNIAKLAKLDSAALNATLSIIDNMEPTVIAGQRGSRDAVEFSEIGKNLEKRQMKKLRSETVDYFRKMTGKRLKIADEPEGKDTQEMSGPVEAPVAPGKDPHAVPGSGGDEVQLAKHMARMGECLAAGDMEGAQAHHAMCMKHMEGEGDAEMAFGKDDEKEMSEGGAEGAGEKNDAAQKQLDELSTQMARLTGLVSNLMKDDEEGAKEMEGEPKEDEKEMSAEEEAEEKKKMKNELKHGKRA